MTRFDFIYCLQHFTSAAMQPMSVSLDSAFHLKSVPVKSPNGYTFEVNGYSSKPMRMQYFLWFLKIRKILAAHWLRACIHSSQKCIHLGTLTVLLCQWPQRKIWSWIKCETRFWLEIGSVAGDKTKAKPPPPEKAIINFILVCVSFISLFLSRSALSTFCLFVFPFGL